MECLMEIHFKVIDPENIDWLLFQTKIKHSFSDKSKLDIQLFGLKATRCPWLQNK